MSEELEKTDKKWWIESFADLSVLKLLLLILVLLYLVSVVLSFRMLSKGSPKVSKSSIPQTLIKKAKGKIAVIPIYGAIYKRDSLISEKGSDFIVSMIKKYGEDKDIKGIVLDINSPGGSVAAVQEIHSMIMKVKSRYNKPFVAHIGDVGASGGYYVAAACDKIISNNGSIVGSIGVMFATFEAEDLLKKIGVKPNIIKSGRFKDIGFFARQMTKEERKILEEMIEDTYNTFVDVVAMGRKMSVEKVREIADGRVFTGRQAVLAGLVDKIGDLYDAIDEAGILAGIGKDPEVVRVRAGRFSEILFGLENVFGFIPFERIVKGFLEYRFVF